MIRKYAEIIVSLQICKGILEEDEKMTYMFGYQLLLEKILSGTLMILTASLAGTLGEMILFMAAFLLLLIHAISDRQSILYLSYLSYVRNTFDILCIIYNHIWNMFLTNTLCMGFQ